MILKPFQARSGGDFERLPERRNCDGAFSVLKYENSEGLGCHHTIQVTSMNDQLDPTVMLSVATRKVVE